MTNYQKSQTSASKTHHLKFASNSIAALLRTNAETKLGMAVNIVEIMMKSYRKEGYSKPESVILALAEFAAKPVLSDVDPASLETLVRSREIERQAANKELN